MIITSTPAAVPLIVNFGTAFLVDSKFNHMVKIFTPINERLCVIRIKADFSTTLSLTYCND
jgi:hypothetical protein